MIAWLSIAVAGANKELGEMRGGSANVSTLENQGKPHREGHRPKL